MSPQSYGRKVRIRKMPRSILEVYAEVLGMETKGRWQVLIPSSFGPIEDQKHRFDRWEDAVRFVNEQTFQRHRDSWASRGHQDIRQALVEAAQQVERDLADFASASARRSIWPGRKYGQESS